MRKRLLYLLLAVCLTYSLCACGEGGEYTEGGSNSNSVTTSEASGVPETGVPGSTEDFHENVKELTSFEKLFSNGPIPSQDTNELWGYIDSTGNWVVSPVFADAKSFWDSGLAPVRDMQSQLWGLIDTSGQYVVGPTFDQIADRVSDSLFRVHVPNQGWGYIDATGTFVIESQFDDARDFSGGFARVSSQMQFTGQNSYRLWGYINTSGERITEDIFSEAYDFSEGLACAKQGDIFSGLYGYIDDSGKFAIDPLYTEATSFSDGVAFVSMWAAGNTYYGLIGKDGYGITGPICGSLPSANGYTASFNYGLRPVWTLDITGQVYINTDGEVVLPKNDEPYQSASSFSGGYAMACKNDLYGYIDLDGNWTIPPQYVSASNFLDDMALVEVGSLDEILNGNSRRRIIDTAGNCILEIGGDVTLSRWNWRTPERIAVSDKTSGKIGFWNLAGDILIDYMFDETQNFAEDYSYAKVKYNGLWGVIDMDGNWLISAQFMSLG